jgi:hypothetical protein
MWQAPNAGPHRSGGLRAAAEGAPARPQAWAEERGASDFGLG